MGRVGDSKFPFVICRSAFPVATLRPDICTLPFYIVYRMRYFHIYCYLIECVLSSYSDFVLNCNIMSMSKYYVSIAFSIEEKLTILLCPHNYFHLDLRKAIVYFEWGLIEKPLHHLPLVVSNYYEIRLTIFSRPHRDRVRRRQPLQKVSWKSNRLCGKPVICIIF